MLGAFDQCLPQQFEFVENGSLAYFSYEFFQKAEGFHLVPSSVVDQYDVDFAEKQFAFVFL